MEKVVGWKYYNLVTELHSVKTIPYFLEVLMVLLL